MQKPKHVLIEKNFFAGARALRETFERKFSNPRDTRSDRFVWDFWHIEDQYRLLRTPARHYFPEAQYRKLEASLLDYAKVKLGCSGLSEPWLSCYVDGCEQNFHADNPHGPWAFVYSLTPWTKRTFRGGETLVAKPALLDYWSHFSSERGLEVEDLFQEIPAAFNQLLVFDPRLPHGVKRVQGALSPEAGRLVIHGWFTEPRPFIDGALARGGYAKLSARLLDETLAELQDHLADLGALHGTLTVELGVTARGTIQTGKILTHTLLSREAGHSRTPRAVQEAIRLIFTNLGAMTFPKSNGPSRVTIPFLFR